MAWPADSTDEDLMQAFAEGLESAFETLYDRHSARVWRFLYRSVQNSAAADDLSQEVWLRVARSTHWRARDASGTRASFSAWLFTLARNLLIDEHRASKPTVSLDAPLDQEEGPTMLETLAAPSGFGPVHHVETRQQAAQLMAALDALAPAQREAFLLQAEGQMSVAQIALATGVALETAKSRLRYARAALRKTLEQMT